MLVKRRTWSPKTRTAQKTNSQRCRTTDVRSCGCAAPVGDGRLFYSIIELMFTSTSVAEFAGRVSAHIEDSHPLSGATRKPWERSFLFFVYYLTCCQALWEHQC